MSVSDPAADAARAHIAPVTTREELIYLLSRASELEHGLACVYLFVCHSLKSDVAEGRLTYGQARLVRGWKRKLAFVAVEEMLHLAQVTNIALCRCGQSKNKPFCDGSHWYVKFADEKN
jgi:CDGSH-type Zn-finger protein